MIGVLADSEGNIDALDTALQLLLKKGAKRFLFAGGRYSDIDAWVQWRFEKVRAQTDYQNTDFLADVSAYLLGQDQVERPPAFGTYYETWRTTQELTRVTKRVMRTPEKGSLSYLDKSVPKKNVDIVGDALCCVVHDRNDLVKDDLLNGVLFVHGKEAEPKVVQIGPRYFVAPGKVNHPKEASVGTLEIAERQVKFTAFHLDGSECLAPQMLNVTQKTKLAVK